MDFQLAADYLHNTFTLGEKQLAKDLSESFYLDELPRTVYIRRPFVQLAEVFNEAQVYVQTHTKEDLRRLVLYCDTINLTEGLVIGYKDSEKPFGLQVFARKVECQNASQALHMHFSEDCQLEFYTYELKEGFTARLEFGDGSIIKLPLSIAPESWGITVNWDGTKFLFIDHDSTALDMTTANYLNRIKSDGTLETGNFIENNDNLPRLAMYQFLVAATIIKINPKLALEILNWVCNLSAHESSAALNIHACSLRNSLVLSQERKVFNVPSVNIYASRQVLESRLAASTAFEQAFQNFAAQERTSAAVLGQTVNLIAKSEDAMSEYAFLEDLAQKAYSSAQSAREVAFNRYNQNNTDLAPLQREFSKGLEDWCTKKKIEAAKAVFSACISTIGAITATVASGGLAAPMIPAAAGKAVEAADKIAKIIETIKDVIERIKEIYKKLKPILEKLKKLAETIQAVVTALNASQTLQEKTAIQRPDMSLDIYNATALWDIFKEKVDQIEKTVATIEFPAKEEYFFALRTLVINGKTYLQTQENLCQRGNELAIILLKVKLQHKEKQRLTLSAKATEQQGAVLDLLKRAMFDRLLSIRSLVFLDFYMYSEAYMFHALTDKPPVNISPVKPVLDYLEDAARFQGNVAAFGSRVMVQQRRFSILTCGDAVNTSSLRDKLLKNESVFVSLDPKDAMFAGFSRIRVSKARCYLEGASVAPDSDATGEGAGIRLFLKTSGRFYDINLPGRKDGAAPFNAFVGDARALLFEYSVKDRSIICDGEYGQNLDYTRQSPLTEWELSIGAGGLQARDLDFTNLKGIRMEFWCDITLKI
ncbi:uncharacterized protein FOBCDRAFT_144708 [Fusarium oxysporum Fo47]|uniref:Uncharacterized protein n=1 Tax=Fusarium oxysporum Fo47 TaxID=660027 RepID=W9JE73_FUSOX|nr:uncharacterized protein FOBCDRAFT_144708 [Fusarium oxysporum Fo47]EWZ30181.1 hypothetical protein FOZG_16347 [Fusarium oxysporum Fo47]QKD59220.1 hypothetical protein FOBCDRAFT_144708 [Fusarium oxysporum Fo47]